MNKKGFAEARLEERWWIVSQSFCAFLLVESFFSNKVNMNSHTVGK